jgi:hypothetical protein
LRGTHALREPHLRDTKLPAELGETRVATHRRIGRTLTWSWTRGGRRARRMRAAPVSGLAHL